MILGGVVVDFIGDKLAGTATTFGQYASGLPIGLIIYIIVALISGQKPVWLERLQSR